MTVLSWTLFGILAVAICLYVFSIIKNIKILTGIISILFIPLACTPLLLCLNQYLPDAHHIRFYSILAVSLISISEALVYFSFTKYMKFAGEFFYAASIVMWINLYKTTFYFFHVSTVALVVETVFFTIIYIILLIYIRKQKGIFYICRIPEYYALIFLHFSAVTTALNVSSKAYTLPFILGTTLLIAEQLIFVLQTTRPVEINRKIERTIRTSLITFAEVLLTLTGLLMIK